MSAGVLQLTVLQLSDLHLFSGSDQDLLGLNTYDALKKTLEVVKALPTPPDLILITGDLAQEASPETYRDIDRIFSEFSMPIYAVPGNHDDSVMMEQVLTHFPFMSDRIFTQQGWQFILLDSSVQSQVRGHLSAETLASLDNTLQACQNPTVIALHHPAYPVQSAWLDDGLENYPAFWQVLDRHPHVKIVLSGHVHQALTFARHGVQYLSTPSTCVQFKPRSQTFAVDDRAPGFRLLSLFTDGSFQSWVERVPILQQANLASTGY